MIDDIQSEIINVSIEEIFTYDTSIIEVYILTDTELENFLYK